MKLTLTRFAILQPLGVDISSYNQAKDLAEEDHSLEDPLGFPNTKLCEDRMVPYLGGVHICRGDHFP